jgi:hypothetical protein
MRTVLGIGIATVFKERTGIGLGSGIAPDILGSIIGGIPLPGGGSGSSSSDSTDSSSVKLYGLFSNGQIAVSDQTAIGLAYNFKI